MNVRRSVGMRVCVCVCLNHLTRDIFRDLNVHKILQERHLSVCQELNANFAPSRLVIGAVVKLMMTLALFVHLPRSGYTYYTISAH